MLRMSVLGIDAGGSGTKVVLLQGSRFDRVTELPAAPPMNALLTDGIAGRLAKIISAAPGVAAVGIGLPGLRSAGAAGQLSQRLRRRVGRPVIVTGDGDIARAGAFGGGSGIIVIAGTGSAAVGWDGSRRLQAGGDDNAGLAAEGSAYWIGRCAVRAALRWADGMGGSAAIHRAILEVTGISLDELIVKINSHSSERTVVSVLAPLITDLAETDAAARRITERAADHLAALAAAVQRRLGPLAVAGTGGVLGSPLIWERFAAQTGAERPQASPAVGAALLAVGLLPHA
jgi:N-acetylglucosamine kinase-like BadF-type ATPase